LLINPKCSIHGKGSLENKVRPLQKAIVGSNPRPEKNLTPQLLLIMRKLNFLITPI